MKNKYRISMLPVITCLTVMNILVLIFGSLAYSFTISHLSISYNESTFRDPYYGFSIRGPKQDNFDYILLKNPFGITLLDSRVDILSDWDDKTFLLWKPGQGYSTAETGYYTAELWLNDLPEVHVIDFEVKLENIPKTTPVISNPVQSSTVIAPPFTMSWEEFDLIGGEDHVAYNIRLVNYTLGGEEIFHVDVGDNLSYTYYDPIEAGVYSAEVYALAFTYIQKTDFIFTYERAASNDVVFNIAPVKPKINVNIDIKPQSCPNPVNTKSGGVLPVAILGTSTFDANKIDVATVKLEGVSPLRSALEDVATPFALITGKRQATDCNTAGPDGFLDLTLKFDNQAVVAALGTVTDGEVRILTMTGNLKDGTLIEGEDVVVILKKR